MSQKASIDRFELGLLADRSVDRAIPLRQLLEMTAAGKPWPALLPDDATLFFESGGRDWMPLHWVLGDLISLSRQFDAAADRLQAGHLAIVRSAVDDRPVVSYFLFEPHDDDISISIFYPPDNLRYVYPTGKRGAELHTFVANNREALLTRPQNHDSQRDILNARIGRTALIDALTREAERARRVMSLLGND